MDFSLSDEQRMILGTVREFVHKELLPLEADIQRAELEGRHFPDRSTLRQLQGTARKAGLWGLLTPEEYGGVTAFLVDRAMGWSSRRIETMGSWGPAELHFDNVRVPGENVLGEVGEGFKLAMAWIGQGRLLIPARAVGQAQRLLEMGREYARQRIAFGHPIGDYQAIQWMLADSAVEIEEVGWLVLSAA